MKKVMRCMRRNMRENLFKACIWLGVLFLVTVFAGMVVTFGQGVAWTVIGMLLGIGIIVLLYILAKALVAAFVPDNGMLAKSIRRHISDGDNYSARELFHMVDKDVAHGTVFESTVLGGKWLLERWEAMLLEDIRGVFRKDTVIRRGKNGAAPQTNYDVLLIDRFGETQAHRLLHSASRDALCEALIERYPDLLYGDQQDYAIFREEHDGDVEFELFNCSFESKRSNRKALSGWDTREQG